MVNLLLGFDAGWKPIASATLACYENVFIHPTTGSMKYAHAACPLFFN
jgi:hypothetical protein